MCFCESTELILTFTEPSAAGGDSAYLSGQYSEQLETDEVGDL